MHGTDVVFLGVSVDEAKDKQKWLDFIETEGLKGIQLLANGWSKITKDYKINGFLRSSYLRYSMVLHLQM